MLSQGYFGVPNLCKSVSGIGKGIIDVVLVYAEIAETGA